MEEARILKAKGGKVRLLGRSELDAGWDPAAARRLTVWEVTQQLIRALEQKGESGATDLLRKLGSLGEVARDLAYRLYIICEHKKWSQAALAYNSLVMSGRRSPAWRAPSVQRKPRRNSDCDASILPFTGLESDDSAGDGAN